MYGREIDVHREGEIYNRSIIRNFILEMYAILDGEAKRIDVTYKDGIIESNLKNKIQGSKTSVIKNKQRSKEVNNYIEECMAKSIIDEDINYYKDNIKIKESLAINDIEHKVVEVHSGFSSNEVFNLSILSDLIDEIVETLNNMNKEESDYLYFQTYLYTQEIPEKDKEYEELYLPEVMLKIDRRSKYKNKLSSFDDSLIIKFSKRYFKVSFWNLKNTSFSNEVEAITKKLKKDLGKILLQKKFAS